MVKGFPEGEGGHSEFLFSLPRFAESGVSDWTDIMKPGDEVE